MSREGEARRPALLELSKRSPRPLLLPTVSRPCCLPCLSAVCRSAATASLPCGCPSVAQRAKTSAPPLFSPLSCAALARCATLGQPHGGSIEKTTRCATSYHHTGLCASGSCCASCGHISILDARCQDLSLY